MKRADIRRTDWRNDSASTHRVALQELDQRQEF